MDLLLGLDVGTTATKALAFDPTGKVVASASQPYTLITPQEGWVEQDPEALWGAVVSALHALSANLSPDDRILALSQASQGGTTIPLDSNMQPVCNAFSWMDQRAHLEHQQVNEEFGADALYRLTGWPLMPALPLMHICWLRRNRQHLFDRARYFTFVNDFIGYRLTGELVMDPSDASITQLLNIASGNWDERLLELAGITLEQLSPVQPSGQLVGSLSATASRLTGLPHGLPLFNGAHDQYCAAVGLGVTRPGPLMLSTGTAWVLLLVPESLDSGLHSGMALSCHAAHGRWGALRSLGGVGSSLEWLIDQVWGVTERSELRRQALRELDEVALRSPAGASGLLFFPLAGGHAEAYGMGLGGFVGMTLKHNRADMARAAMEGIAYELRWAIEEISATGVKVDEVIMVGGAARSRVWAQIVADICSVRLQIPPITQAAGWGAALLAGLGIGTIPSLEAAPRFPGETLRFVPHPESQSIYDAGYQRYRYICPLISHPGH